LLDEDEKLHQQLMSAIVPEGFQQYFMITGAAKKDVVIL
jgi:hypothetical protein